MRALGWTTRRCRPSTTRLIYASISGYGQTGPDRAKGGFDLVAQGASGLMSVTGEPAGRRSRPACRSPISAPDCSRSPAILAALHHRDRTGRGQYIDTSLLEAGLALSVWEAAEFFAGGTCRSRWAPRIGSWRRIRRSGAPTGTSRSAPARIGCSRILRRCSGILNGPGRPSSRIRRRASGTERRSSPGSRP